MTSRDHLRIGDAERDEMMAALREHFAQGRLTQEELEERLGLTLGAKTGGELAKIAEDLPAPAGRAQPQPRDDQGPWPGPWQPGTPWHGHGHGHGYGHGHGHGHGHGPWRGMYGPPRMRRGRGGPPVAPFVILFALVLLAGGLGAPLIMMIAMIAFMGAGIARHHHHRR
ncbi:DUF1707 SHOCT-like domain-containing protein [Spongiactinospora rosea]|uniref:DUF1707 SHOCT-like domain-containing protein n=1 Tax=Spongiactinospora rosea TaxID=2248750 RepID=UPI0018F2E3C2|nr:DUF1707 domain-containing protein [Spongiactinospora rosea]